jgi:hypothetical protein
MSKKTPEDELREEVYDEIINAGEIYNCAGCKLIIRGHKMKCDACKEEYLCTFCFAKLIMAENSGCPECSGAFLPSSAKAYLDELVQIYKSNPRDLFTILQKKKKQLPPSLKNIENVIKSAMGEAKLRGEKLPLP